MSRGNDIEIRGKPSGYSSVSNISNSPSGVGLSNRGQVRFQPISHMINTNTIKALPGNSHRQYLMVQNQSTADIFIGFGVSINQFGANGFRLAAGGFLELDNVVSTDQIFIVSTAAQSRVLVIEGVKGER